MWYLKPQIQEYYLIDKVFTNEELNKIIELGLSLDIQPSKIGGNLEEVVNNEYRSSENSWMYVTEENSWIYQRITDVIMDVNTKNYEFKLDSFTDFQFTIYDSKKKGHYGIHKDSTFSSGRYYRKLSMILMLSDPKDFVGGDLNFYLDNLDKHITIPQEKGRIVIFPSFQLHEVTPVTEGIRYSLVTWVSGPNFR